MFFQTQEEKEFVNPRDSSQWSKDYRSWISQRVFLKTTIMKIFYTPQ
jgi:hypothetical protein